MRTPVYLASLAVFGLASAFNAQPARAAIDCNRCEAQFNACLAQGNDYDYCLGAIAPACLRQCPIASATRQADPFALDRTANAVAMTNGKPSASILADVQ